MAFSLIGSVKLGQPVPLSNFSPESNNSLSQQTQPYLPGSYLEQCSPENLASVPFFLVM